MNSIKNVIVVVLLLGVSYGAFQVINAPEPALDEEVQVLDIQYGTPVEPNALASSMDVPSPSNQPSSQQAQSPALLPPDKPPVSNLDEIDLKLPELTTATDPVPPNVESANPTPKAVPPTAPVSHPDPPAIARDAKSNHGQFQPTPQTDLHAVVPKVKPTQDSVSAVKNAAPSTDFTGQFALDIDQPAATDSTKTPGNSNTVPSPPIQLNLPDESVNASINWQEIERLVNDGALKNALSELSKFYNVTLPADQRMRLLEWLDALAGKVIYSTEHHLMPRPYIVQAGDTLQSLAARWNVPAELIYNINHSKIGASRSLIEGTELKQISGPFHAQVSMEQGELTLFVSGMYAGRFAVQLDNGQEIGHGLFSLDNARNNIRLSSRDANDVYNILSDKSQIKMMR